VHPVGPYDTDIPTFNIYINTPKLEGLDGSWKELGSVARNAAY
jgi:hypothetical protein